MDFFPNFFAIKVAWVSNMIRFEVVVVLINKEQGLDIQRISFVKKRFFIFFLNLPIHNKNGKKIIATTTVVCFHTFGYFTGSGESEYQKKLMLQ
jgi:hypothetical protein